MDQLSGDGAVHGNLMPDDVLQDALVGRRLPAGIVLRLQTVDRDDDRETAEAVPLLGNFADGARDQLHVNAAIRQDRQQRPELSVADQRLSTDDRQVQGPMLVDQTEHPVDQFLALEIAQLAEVDLAAEMLVAVRIAAGAAQRTLARDLD